MAAVAAEPRQRGADAAAGREPYLSARGIAKRYGATLALDGVSLDLHAGEVHALVGENGAGKSTLMKVLAGEERPDAGDIVIAGRPVRLASPFEARAHGIAVVHQHFPMVPAMTVAENLHLGDPPVRHWPLGLTTIDRKRMAERSAHHLGAFGLAAKVDRPVRELAIAERQVVEIAKALRRDARLLILDEPTSSLDAAETASLFEHLRRLKARGAAIVFIAHSIEEVLAIADRITVLRDGRLIGTVPAQGLEASALVRMIVGRDLAKGYPKAEAALGDNVIEARDVALERHGSARSFAIRRGEILGLPAHMGSGVEALLAVLSGERRPARGRLALGERDVTALGLRGRIRAGICLVPGDALEKGLMPKMTIEDNILLPNLRSHTRFGITQGRRARRLCETLIALLDIRPARPTALIEQLSGGNRQKVVIAKWLAAGAKVLVMDDPTKGVDIGAKVEIYSVIGDVVQKGGAVALASTDLDELIGLADRMIVIRDGGIVGELSERPFDKAHVVARLAGVDVTATGRASA